MTKGHFISNEAERILKVKGLKISDVEDRFQNKIEELMKKKYADEKQPWSKQPRKMRRKIGRLITLKQSNFPFKMFVLQEVFLEGEKEPEIRLGYYIVSPKTLIEQGKIRLVWGQYNPNIPKKDFIELVRMAREEGIIK